LKDVFSLTSLKLVNTLMNSNIVIATKYYFHAYY